MGKWCQVMCNCSNRNLIGKRDFEKVYACGHKNGMLVEGWQGDLMKVSIAIKNAFDEHRKIFEKLSKISTENEYKDEKLFLLSEESELLKMEIEEIKRLIEGNGNNVWREWQTFISELERESPHESLNDILNFGDRLCLASIKTKNPIEFYL